MASELNWNVADLMEALTDSYPDREALVVDGGPRLSWAELDDRASRLANYFLESGLSPGAHVGCYCINGNEYLETMVACFKARMVPINVNWRYKADEVKYLFDDADLAACVIDPEFAEIVEDVRTELPKLAHVIVTGGDYESRLSSASAERPLAGMRSGDDRYFLYTGGTTGYPKGVEWRQEDIIGAVWRTTGNLDMSQPPGQVVDLASSPRTRYLAIPPFMHGAAHWGAFGCWLAGGTVLCMRSRSLDAEATLSFAASEAPNLMLIVGDAFAAPLLKELDAAKDRGKPYDLSSLKVLVSSGAPLSIQHKEAFQARIPRIVIADTLGSSESGVQAIAPWRPEIQATRFVMNEVTTILDEDTLEPIEPGSGRQGVLAKSGYLPLGYYKDPEKTKKTFPEARGRRWVITGDHATAEADGSIILLGRGSNCINTGGEKVYPEEVEAAIKAHPAVSDVLVVGVPDERFGSAIAAVIAADIPVGVDEIRSFTAERLAGYKSPRQVVQVDAVPRAPSGKPDYKSALEIAVAANASC